MKSTSQGRPRSPEADTAIIRATRELLAEGRSIDRISIEAVAARAHVGKMTIYRRWTDKSELVMSALENWSQVPATPSGRPAREAVSHLLTDFAEWLAGNPEARMLPWLLGSRQDNGRIARTYRDRIIEPRHRALAVVLRCGIRHGEIRADLDVDSYIRMAYGALLFSWLTDMGEVSGTIRHLVGLPFAPSLVG